MALARSHYENFPTASRLLSPEIRPAVAVIYAFARYADDIADEGIDNPEVRLKKLDAWESLLRRCTKEKVDHPVFLALGDTIQHFNLPTDPFHDLLVAFRMDVTIHAYATPKELQYYCSHSANPIGRLLLALYDIRNTSAFSTSDSLCTALQLTNFWQDLSIDLSRGRCYLCEEWLSAAGINSNEILKGKIDEKAIRVALDEAIDFTDGLFCKAHQLPAYLPFRLRLQCIATICGGQAILQHLRKSNPLTHRPLLSRRIWISLLPRIVLMTVGSYFHLLKAKP